jgi:hypothetical protein
MSAATALRKRALILLVCLVGLPALIGAYISTAKKPETIAAGDRLMSIEGSDLDRRSVTLTPNGRRGQVWLIVSASCPICREELAELEQQPAREDVTVISLSDYKDTDALMRAFPKMKARTVVDDHKQLEAAFGKFRFPTSIVLDEQGLVLDKWRGRSRPETRHVP